jgi:hypothetical protein
LRTGYLGYGSEDDGPGLELIQTGAADRRRANAPWSGHVALYFSDLYRLSETLKAAGVKLTMEPRPNRPGSKDLIAFIQSPDG